MLETYAANPDGTDYVIGDLHGCFDELQAALATVDFDRRHDRLFSVGDLIDRGPRSLDCLRLALEPWFHAVRGNHEELARQALIEDSPRGLYAWWLNGGGWVRSEDIDEVRALLAEALPAMPFALEVACAGRRVGVVHAEPPSDWARVSSADAALRQSMVWSRQRLGRHDTTPIAGIDVVVVGHSILEAPRVLGNVVHIDTGAFARGGYLTLAPLEALVEAVMQGAG